MPDVCIWMISGTKRIAYARIPANELLWAAHHEYRGKDCGKLITVRLKVSALFIFCVLRLSVFFLYHCLLPSFMHCIGNEIRHKAMIADVGVFNCYSVLMIIFYWVQTSNQQLVEIAMIILIGTNFEQFDSTVIVTVLMIVFIC